MSDLDDLPGPGDPRAGSFLLRAGRVSKCYTDGRVTALDEVDFGIRAGEHVAIVGPSGCGKSTLLNLLGGLDRPTRGEIYYADAPLSGMRDLHRFRSRHIGYIFQSFHLIPTLTALENVQIPLFESSLPRSDWSRKAARLLDAVGLRPRASHLPAQLSVGERQRVTIARALANDPDVLLADEPTGNLDTRTAAEIGELFALLRRERAITLVEVTHAESVAARVDRVIRMCDGRIVSDSCPAGSSPVGPAQARDGSPSPAGGGSSARPSPSPGGASTSTDRAR
jgi:putative ABC transport system ATP-binding protein